MKRLIWLLPVFTLLLCGCQPKSATRQFFAMDTVMSITAYGETADQALAAAVNRINELERVLSRTREGSEIYELNRWGNAEIGQDTCRILSLALEWTHRTGGAFDITVAPVSAAWGFSGDGDHQIPSDGEINELLSLVDSSAVILNQDSVQLQKEGMEIDLGGIAKGYASGQAEQILRENGVKSALLDLGGNITLIGSKPDGSAWRIAVQDPCSSSETVGTLSLTDCSAVTSGAYQRFFQQDGVTYHHIIDPATGYPAEKGLLCVTAVCSDPTLADILSTALFVMGEDSALDLWRAEGGFELVLVTDDRRLIVTEGLKDLFEENASCGYTLEYAKK